MSETTEGGGTLVDLKARTREYSLRIIRLCGALPNAVLPQTLGKQLLRSGTSAGAHYREASRSRSDKEFISKMEGGLQELEESAYWLELLVGADIISGERLAPLMKETDELIAIFTTCVKRREAKAKARKSRARQP